MMATGKTSTDTLTPAERSARMALVRNKDTKPELLVRRLVHGMGYGTVCIPPICLADLISSSARATR